MKFKTAEAYVLVHATALVKTLHSTFCAGCWKKTRFKTAFSWLV